VSFQGRIVCEGGGGKNKKRTLRPFIKSWIVCRLGLFTVISILLDKYYSLMTYWPIYYFTVYLLITQYHFDNTIPSLNKNR